MNISVVGEMVKMMSILVIMMAPLLTSVTRAMESWRLLVYCPISAPNGTYLCAVDGWYTGPEPEVFDDVQLSSCALSTMMSHSAVFNYNRTDGRCDVFHESPWFYEPVDGCVAYEVPDCFTFSRPVVCALARENIKQSPRTRRSRRRVVCALGWLGSRVVSVLDSGAEGPRVQLAVVTMSRNSLRQTVHTHCASVHQAAKLVAALLRVAGVTAGLAESTGSLPPGL